MLIHRESPIVAATMRFCLTAVQSDPSHDVNNTKTSRVRTQDHDQDQRIQTLTNTVIK